MSEITFDEFQKLDVRVGTIQRAEVFAEARKAAYKLWVDFGGEIGVKKSSAQITTNYDLDDLVGRQVLGVVNFAPRQIGPFKRKLRWWLFQRNVETLQVRLAAGLFRVVARATRGPH